MDKSCGAPDTEVPEVSVPSTKADTYSWNLCRELAIINIIVYAHNRHLTNCLSLRAHVEEMTPPGSS
jgi:hypothetical protein